MTTRVECHHCGARYETEAPIAAIKEVARCQECGATTLVIVDEAEAGEEAQARQD